MKKSCSTTFTYDLEKYGYGKFCKDKFMNKPKPGMLRKHFGHIVSSNANAFVSQPFHRFCMATCFWSRCQLDMVCSP